MKKKILTAVTLLVCAFGHAQQAEKSATEVSEWLTSFDGVVVDAPVDITFVGVPATEAPKIVYDTHGSYTSKFKAAVKDKVLRIAERFESHRTDRTSVVVYYNDLRSLDLSDAAATFSGTLTATAFDLRVGGGARLTAALDVKDFKAELSAKSAATLTGKARYLWLYVSTGTFDASGLEAMAAQVNAVSGAQVQLWVTDRLEAKTSTNAKISYKGDPSILRVGTKFMGGDILRAESGK